MVYDLLNERGMCAYYQLNKSPGINKPSTARNDKFSFLDNTGIQQKLINFKDGEQVHVSFYLPQVHCSSCLWLLENLHQLNDAVIQSSVNFPAKQITVVYAQKESSLREIVELLANLGYEPYISLDNLQPRKATTDKNMMYRLGIAGFCFANIMLLSFPEYLGIDAAESLLQSWFRGLSLLLSLPVLFYCAQPFYISAFKSATHKFMNIDAPITLAILVTFIRSVFEVLVYNGSGYFDSMSGIVFFMLIGRALQEKTHRQLSFDRDYTAYFPIAVTVLNNEKETAAAVTDIKPGNTLLIHHEELIPADGILTRGRAVIDYSFVTGESLPVIKEVGELIYAGGRQTAANIELLVIKEVSQSYLTSLWNKETAGEITSGKDSFVNILSKYFTWFVFATALLAGMYWQWSDPSRTWNVVTAVLIIACPCALLLASSFTNGNILRILGRNRFYLRNAQAIENIASVNHIVFDKTGTLTAVNNPDISYEGEPLTQELQCAVAALAAQSNHPLCKAIVAHLPKLPGLQVGEFMEEAGKGILGVVNGVFISLGSGDFVKANDTGKNISARVYVCVEGKVTGHFTVRPTYRTHVPEMVDELKKSFTLSVLSGDNNSEFRQLQRLFGADTDIQFYQSPFDKKTYIQRLQNAGNKVMMIGDGLNDAGALKQSHAGIAISEKSNNFTPASDAILDARSIQLLPALIRLCRLNKTVVTASFAFSIIYNIIGIYFAVQGILSPVIAAILMPASSISILLLTFGFTNLNARKLNL